MRSPRFDAALLGLIAAALVGISLLALPASPFHMKPRQGVDLQGGLAVVLQANPPPGHALTEEDLDRSVEIMRARIDKLGVSEPEIRKQGDDQIVIELPAVHDQEQAAQIIGKTAQLELYDLTPSLLPPSIGASQEPVATTRLRDLLTRAEPDRGPPSAYYLVDATTQRTLAGPADTVEELAGQEAVAELSRKRGVAESGLPKGARLVPVPPQAVVVTCSAKTAAVCPGAGAPGHATYYYLFKHGSAADFPDDRGAPYPQMTGDLLKLAGTRQDFDPTTGKPIVTLQFTGKGNDAFRQITLAEAQRGAILGVEQSFAIVLDDELYSFPTIDYRQYPGGIDPTGGGAQISGMPSLAEAKQLAIVLQTGALPVRFETIEHTDVSATLGKDSLEQARNAAIGGLIAVAVFLLVLYRLLGLVAVVGLVVYAAFMYAAILILGVTLTLPGFAGLIVTIGVAADANVVVFERIREEARTGRPVRSAIAAGYARGFHTILDANVVTCITALVLFGFATASVKGFALMLLIGTVISLLTAVAATRAMLGVLARFSWFGNARLVGLATGEVPRWQQIDVAGRRRLWLLVSLAAIAASLAAIAFKGLNLGIDFKGGVQVTFTTPRPTSLGEVRREIAVKGSVVQGRGDPTGEDEYRSFQVRLPELSPAGQAELTTGLTEQLEAQVGAVKNVSASFSRQILNGALWSIGASFALIALYVTIRYRWRFAVPILRTLLSDIPIALGVYALSGREVTAATVAAMLTILGYSIYDTIIVFDRVRENIRRMPHASIATIANVSVSEVLRRSLITSVITLLPIAALFLFGGPTLQDFAFAIIVGITVGAISTIFIATPLLVGLMERDPQFAGRANVVPG